MLSALYERSFTAPLIISRDLFISMHLNYAIRPAYTRKLPLLDEAKILNFVCQMIYFKNPKHWIKKKVMIFWYFICINQSIVGTRGMVPPRLSTLVDKNSC